MKTRQRKRKKVSNKIPAEAWVFFILFLLVVAFMLFAMADPFRERG